MWGQYLSYSPAWLSDQCPEFRVRVPCVMTTTSSKDFAGVILTGRERPRERGDSAGTPSAQPRFGGHAGTYRCPRRLRRETSCSTQG